MINNQLKFNAKRSLLLLIGVICNLSAFGQLTGIPTSLDTLFNTIKAQESKFPLPQTTLDLTIGTLDLNYETPSYPADRWDNPPRVEMSFKYNIPQYTNGSFYSISVPL